MKRHNISKKVTPIQPYCKLLCIFEVVNHSLIQPANEISEFKEGLICMAKPATTLCKGSGTA